MVFGSLEISVCSILRSIERDLAQLVHEVPTAAAPSIPADGRTSIIESYVTSACNKHNHPIPYFLAVEPP